MDERAKKRLVGAAIVVSLFVILTPMVLDRTRMDPVTVPMGKIPPMPEESAPGQLLRLDQPPPELTAELPAEPDDGVAFEEPPPEAEPSPPPVAPAPAVQSPRPVPPGAPAPVRGAGAVAGQAKPPPVPDEKLLATAEPKPVTEPRPADARVGLSAWAVQLTAFANAANAVSLRDALRGRGFVAFVETTPEKTTRVYLGPELQKQNAVAAQQRLARELGIKGAVVAYPGGGTP